MYPVSPNTHMLDQHFPMVLIQQLPNQIQRTNVMTREKENKFKGVMYLSASIKDDKRTIRNK